MSLIKYFLLLAFLSSLTLGAVRGPLLLAPDSAKIIDIGQRNAAVDGTVLKVWRQYQADYSVIDDIIATQARQLSDVSICHVDSNGISVCPISQESCEEESIYMDGNATIVHAKYTTEASCPVGTTPSVSLGACESEFTCEEGVYNPARGKCQVSSDESYSNYYWLSQANSSGWHGAMVFTGRIEQLPDGAPGYGFMYPYNVTKTCNSRDYGKCAFYTTTSTPTYTPNLNDPKVINYVVNARSEPNRWDTNEHTDYGYGYLGLFSKYANSVPYIYGSKNGWHLLKQDVNTTEVEESDPTCVAEDSVIQGNRCVSQTLCPIGTTKTAWDTCEQNYSYSEYTCTDDINTETGRGYTAVDAGGDCGGLCNGLRSEDCYCNPNESPDNNCKTDTYTCPISNLPCSQRDTAVDDQNAGNGNSAIKDLQLHSIVGGVGDAILPQAYGMYLDEPCADGCDAGLKHINTSLGQLCFTTGSKTVCVDVNDCEFTGAIYSYSSTNIGFINTNGNTLSAYDVNGVNLGSLNSSCNLNGSVGYLGRDKPILSMIVEDNKMKFWNYSANEGYLGFIEAVGNVHPEHIGYAPSNMKPWTIQEAGFNRIETYNGKTYYISSSKMNYSQCRALSQELGLIVETAPIGVPIHDKMPYEIMVNSTAGNVNDPSGQSSCVLISTQEGADFDSVTTATLQTNEEIGEYICSPVGCNAENTCQTASCVDDYVGNIISSEKPVPEAGDCLSQDCDARSPYYNWCGKSTECYRDNNKFHLIDGVCHETVCSEGGYDNATGLCFKWQCPEGYQEQGGTCVKN